MGKWEMVRLGDVIDILNGFAFKSEKYIDDGIRVIRITNVQKGVIEDSQPQFYPISETNEKYYLFENDLLLSLTGNVGRVAIISKEYLPAALNQRVACLRIKNEIYTDKRYIFSLLNSNTFENECIASSKGVAQKNMSTEWLKQYKIPLPPLEEQKRIAKNLDLASEIVKGYKEQLAELDKLVQSVFYEMFGDPVTNEKGWSICKISHFCDYIVGGGTPSKSIPQYYDGNIPWVTPKDMKCDIITDAIDHITEEAIANSTTKLIPPYAILMVIRSGILKHTLPIAINKRSVTINQDMKAFIPLHSVEVYYLFYALKMSSTHLLKYVRAVTADNIEFSIIKNLIVSKPPLSLQNRFASIITEIEAQKATIQTALTEAENLYNSLMQEYFE